MPVKDRRSRDGRELRVENGELRKVPHGSRGMRRAASPCSMIVTPPSPSARMGEMGTGTAGRFQALGMFIELAVMSGQ